MAEPELSASSAAKRLGYRVQTLIAMCDERLIRHRVRKGVFRRRIYIPVSEIERLRHDSRPQEIL